MGLIISTGSNIGERKEFLLKAKDQLCHHFDLVEESRVYESPAVDYLNQPEFLNQVLHFKIPSKPAEDVLFILLNIEKELGRIRDIDKGPRTLDLDILFWETEQISTEKLTIPHPRLFQRSFIVKPLMELNYFKTLESQFSFPEKFDNSCWVFEG